MSDTVVIEATTDTGSARFVVSNPPHAGELARWAALAQFLPDATWTASQGGLR